jgi:putative transposase
LTGKRLPLDTYSLPGAWHLTIRAAAGTTPFANDALAQEYVGALKASAERYAVDVVAYCAMPDHVHLLVQNLAGIDLINFVRHFKQATGYSFKQRFGKALWQNSFFDRALRKDEDLETVAHYVWENPVKAGLVESASTYRFSDHWLALC